MDQVISTCYRHKGVIRSHYFLAFHWIILLLSNIAVAHNIKPCWKIDSLVGELHYSIPSVRRFLNDVGYYSSFTHNGGWYTLRSLPHFGTDGLWFRDDIGFSRAGSLSKTLIELTSRSPSGMTAEALGKKLRSRCHAVLVQLCRRVRSRCRRGTTGHPCRNAAGNAAYTSPHYE